MTDSYYGEVKDISVDESGRDTSVSEVKIWTALLIYSSTVDGSENFESTTQHKHTRRA
jgi:hypothetical protein